MRLVSKIGGWMIRGVVFETNIKFMIDSTVQVIYQGKSYQHYNR